MLISQDTVSRVRDACNIVDVVGEYLPHLKKAGKDFKGICPFHQEKTPSFMVSPSKGIFHCFGCGMGGDAFKFVMEMDRCSYPEAVQKLADKKGIEVKFEGGSADFSKERERRKKLLHILLRAAQFYHKKLLESADAAEARKYLSEKRKLKDETIRNFQIGWAPAAQGLLAAAKTAGLSEPDLAAAGLISRSQRDGRWVEIFRGRVMFPIYDLKGEIIAFGGRILESQKPKGDFVPPKYLNSPDTELFHKSRNLYGFFQGAKAIRDSSEAIVVEGYMDVIGCHQAGVQNAVAPLGTSLTAEQGQILKRYVKEVILLFDSDRAGENAAQRGAEILIEQGFFPTVARMPTGKDADEFLQTHSKGEFLEILKQRVSLVEFKIDALSKQNPDLPDMVRKSMLLEAVFPLVTKVENEVLKREMLKVIAGKLQVPEDAVYDQFKKAGKSPETRARAGSSKAQPVSPALQRTILTPENEIFCLALLHPEFRARLARIDAEAELIEDPDLRNEVAFLASNEDSDHLRILDAMEEPRKSRIGSLIFKFQQVMGMHRTQQMTPPEIFDTLVRQLELKKIQRRMDQLKKQPKTPETLEAYHQCVQSKRKIEKSIVILS